MSTTANVHKDWKFTILQVEARPRRLILEGHVSPPYERPYYDALYFYAVVGPTHLSLEVSRDFDGERLLDYLFEQLGASEELPRTQVGGRQDEEEGALLLVEWRFPADGRPAMLRRLEEIVGQSLENSCQRSTFSNQPKPKIGKDGRNERWAPPPRILGKEQPRAAVT